MSEHAEQIRIQPPATSANAAPPPPGDTGAEPPRAPMVERLAKVEQDLAGLIVRHNKFIAAVVRELGL